MARYARIFRSPGIAALIVAVTLTRLPFAINGLAILLYVSEETGSFGLAGATAGALALGAGALAPVTARLVDRRGASMLVPIALVHAAFAFSLIAIVAAGLPAALMVAVAALVGASYPPTGAVLRARYPRLLGHDEELVGAAYAFDSVVIEIAFVTGPLLMAAIVALWSPAIGLAIAPCLMVAGTIAFVAALPDRHVIEAPGEHAGRLLGALASRPVRAIVLTTLPVGFCVGAVEVALPAFAHAEGRDELGGLLLAIWSASSAVAGLTFGLKAAGGDQVRRFAVLAIALPLAALPLVVAGSPLAMIALVIVAGVPIAPMIASRNELMSALSPGAGATEAFTWLTTALVSGLAAGNAAAGALVEAGGWEAAVLAGVAVGLLGAAALRGRDVAPSPAPASAVV